MTSSPVLSPLWSRFVFKTKRGVMFVGVLLVCRSRPRPSGAMPPESVLAAGSRIIRLVYAVKGSRSG
ncbi:hypothetical protein CC2G_013360 [Coprinopsis cinerea AmutBmut pab1-1]|nr:hypothetical protein CC2G_013360 [Coprinopsis cinerea AmutBmut pab1-1]